MKHTTTLLAALLLVSCGGAGQRDVQRLTVDELLAEADARVGDTIRLEGLCTETCGHGSTHITLMGSDTTRLIEVRADESLGSFDPAVLHRPVEVEGVVCEQRVEPAFLDDWEMRLDASLEGGQGNPEAVAMLKEQIRELRDSIAARRARDGKDYWSIYRIEASACRDATDR